MGSYQKSIGRNRAIVLYESNWWVPKTAREISRAQLFTLELCVPFDIFHRALEDVLGRPIWYHEFGLNTDGLTQEFLGERDPPTLEEILSLVSPEKQHGLVVEAAD